MISPQLRVTMLYALICTAWIILSDRIVSAVLPARPDLVANAQVIKGVIFVLLTACGLYLLLRHEFRQREVREQKMNASNRTLQIIMNSSPLAIYVLDPNSIVTFWSPASEALFGWQAAEVIGHALPIVPSEYRAESEAIKARILSGEQLPPMELERMRKDGSRVSIRMAAAPTVDYNGNTTGVMMIGRDVSLEKEATRTLRQLAAIVQSSDDAIFSLTSEGQIISWNPGAERLYGYSAEEAIDRPISFLIPPDAAEMATTMQSRLERGERIDHVETTVVTRDGRHVDVSFSAFPITSGDERLMFAVIVRDIAEYRRAQAQLAYQANLLQNVSDAIVAVDTEGQVTSWNKAAETLYGWQAGEVMGLRRGDFLHTEYVNATEADAIHLMTETGLWQGEVIEHHKDGAPLHIFNSISLLKDANGQIIGAVSIERDISWQLKLAEETANRQRLQLELQHEQDMRAVRNRFVSMVSHEFRTPLAAIQSSTDLLLHYADRMSDEQRHERLEQVQEQVGHIIELLNDFLTLSRLETVGLQFDPQPSDLGAILHETVKAARLSWPERQIELSLEDECRPVSVDRRLIRQATLNLLSNAVKYSPDEALILVYLSCLQDAVRVEVRDEGIGIPEEDQAHLFEQFFRASNVGTTEGTGLGLAIVHRAITAHGGKLTLQSKVGVGTVIGYTLPVGSGIRS